jgi:tRNA 2-thiouridine synthesizing protein E
MASLNPAVARVGAVKAYSIQAARFDEDGFLLDPLQWDEDLAQDIAQADHIGGLTESHFRIIRYLREHYLQNQTLPVMRHVCRSLGLEAHSVHQLFGSCREAWRVAGLPNPGEEAKAYMQ